jgi:hypothetical protein
MSLFLQQNYFDRKECETKLYQQQEEYVATENDLRAGNFVWIKTLQMGKMNEKWAGPVRIIKVCPNQMQATCIDVNGVKEKVSVKYLRRCRLFKQNEGGKM